MDPIAEIKAKINIVDLVREYVPGLKQAGANWKALCPFHNEKTPSFMVSDEKEIWHCFGCGEGGDIFEFVKKIEGIEFPEALRILAKKANIKLTRFDPQLQSEKTRLLDLIKLSAAYYHKVLNESNAAQKAREYLKKRGVNEEQIDNFQLGWAPDLWDSLLKFLQKKSYQQREIESAGLILKKEGKSNYYDRFRNRLIFTINDHNGNPIGFGARTLETEVEPKYLNSPQTLIYDKSRVLYALDKAKRSIRQEDLAILVEGYMDVIASHQVGVTNVISVSGTALTLEQLKLLKRYTSNLALCFDQDAAGEIAARRAVEIALNQEFNLKMISLPVDIKDPDECIQKDPQLWSQSIKRAKLYLDYYFDRTFNTVDLTLIEDKKRAAKILLPLIAKIVNPIEHEHYLKIIADKLGVEVSSLKPLIAKQQVKKTQPKVVTPRPQIDQDLIASQKVLAIVIQASDFFPYLVDNLLPQYLQGQENQALYKELIIYYTENQSTDFLQFCKLLKEKNPDLIKTLDVLYLLAAKDFGLDTDWQQEIKKLIKTLKISYLHQQISVLKSKILQAESSKQKQEAKKLTQQLKDYLSELKEFLV